MSDFEQSLKDHADQFKMIPSKRVWNGIYNNLHPGSRWPSITVAIVFLITLITVGHLNNSTSHYIISSKGELKLPKNRVQEQDQKKAVNDFRAQQRSKIDDTQKISLNAGQNSSPADRFNPQDNSAALPQLLSLNTTASKRNYHSPEGRNVSLKSISPKSGKLLKGPTGKASTVSGSIVNPPSGDVTALEQAIYPQSDIQFRFVRQSEAPENDLSIPVSYQIFSYPPAESLFLNTTFINNRKSALYSSDAAGQKNTSLVATKLHRKKNNRIEWTFYVNPAISNVSFNKRTIQPSSNNSSMVVLSGQPSFKLVHNSRFGFQTGAEMSLKIAKKFKFITGINLSYSGYNNVSNLVHPTFATLLLNDNQGGTYSKSYITHYGNGQSQDHINLVNYSVEASIPLGVQYNIWGNEKIKIDVTSLLEPSVVLKDNAYLISSDGRYYVNDPLLVRRTNMAGNLGSYITFIGKKIKWHLGPDIRYQLFSTYKNIYPTQEHLINYGIRIGISK